MSVISDGQGQSVAESTRLRHGPFPVVDAEVLEVVERRWVGPESGSLRAVQVLERVKPASRSGL
jgi:hypothetical protein